MGDTSRFGRSPAAAAVMLTILAAAACGGSWLREPPPERVLDEILPASVQGVLEQQEGRAFRSASGVVAAARPASSGPTCFFLTSGHGQAFLTPATDLQEFLRENLPRRFADEAVLSR